MQPLLKNMIYRLKRVYHWLITGVRTGLAYQLYYGFPEKKLKIIAITGTDGKTTSATLVYQLLKQANFKVALISTVAAYIGSEKIDTGFHVTSPAPHQLYAFMAQMIKKGVEYLVLEVTSQGAYQWRDWGIHPLIAGVTNVERDHLDYHLTWENYLAAKMLILNKAKTVVVNSDGNYFAALKKNLHSHINLLTFSKSIRFSASLEKIIRTKFSEDFNRLNAYLALSVAKQLELTDKQLIAGLNKFQLPPGRMQFIPNKLNAVVIVDFAHTPAGLEAAIKNIRRNHYQKGKKLVVVFGCAGLRDASKRPVMGRLGASLADLAIFTAEDPRSENIWTIINQMKSNLTPFEGKVMSIPHRAQAVSFALNHYAKNGNTVAIFGKGHENSMNYDGKSETPWNDIEACQKYLRRLEKKN